MTTPRLLSIFLLTMLVTTLTSCSIAGDLLKGGIWIGAIAVFLVVALVWWLVTKMGGGGNTPS